MDSVLSSCQVSTLSRALRSTVRSGESQRFFASCWVMVEAPRGARRSSSACVTASRIALGAKPLWWKKSVSSATTTARLRWIEIAEEETQRHSTRGVRPASRSRAL